MTPTATEARTVDSTAYDMTDVEAARYLKCDTVWLQRQARAGKIAHTKLGSRRRFSRSDLDAYVEAHRQEVTRRPAEQARPGMDSISPATRARQARGSRGGSGARRT